MKWQAKRPLAQPASTGINFAKGFDTMDASMVHSKERYMNNKDLEDHRMRQTCTAVLVNVPSDSKRLQVAFMDEIWRTILREHSRLVCTYLVPDIVMCFWNVLISSFSHVVSDVCPACMRRADCLGGKCDSVTQSDLNDQFTENLKRKRPSFHCQTLICVCMRLSCSRSCQMMSATRPE